MSSEDILNQLKEAYLSGIPNHLAETEGYILSMEKNTTFNESRAQTLESIKNNR